MNIKAVRLYLSTNPTVTMLRTIAVGAIVASAAAFAPAGISTMPSTRAGVT